MTKERASHEKIFYFRIAHHCVKRGAPYPKKPIVLNIGCCGGQDRRSSPSAQYPFICKIPNSASLRYGCKERTRTPMIAVPTLNRPTMVLPFERPCNVGWVGIPVYLMETSLSSLHPTVQYTGAGHTPQLTHLLTKTDKTVYIVALSLQDTTRLPPSILLLCRCIQDIHPPLPSCAPAN